MWGRNYPLIAIRPSPKPFADLLTFSVALGCVFCQSKKQAKSTDNHLQPIKLNWKWKLVVNNSSIIKFGQEELLGKHV